MKSKRIKKLDSLVQPSVLTIVNNSNSNENIVTQLNNNVYSTAYQNTNNEVTYKTLNSLTNFQS